MLRGALRLLEDILYPIYIALGPVAWGMLAVLFYLAHGRMNKLVRPGHALPQPPPRVTILVPAKDEESHIAACVESILKQDYPFFSVVLINDRSSDRTGSVIEDLARRDARVRAVHVDHLPGQWLGKCHALHLGAQHADGQWLLFVDSDVKLQPDALRTTLALCEARKYDAASLLTRLECVTWWEKLILPLAAGLWSILHTVSLTNSDSRPQHAAANGQFFLIRRAVYEKIGGHASVKSEITEDVELMRRIKQGGFRTRLFMGRDFASTRMYHAPREMFHGWARIFSGTARRRPWRLLGGAFFLIFCTLSAYLAIGWGVFRQYHPLDLPHTWGWTLAGCIHLMMVMMLIGLVYRFSGNRAWLAGLLPISSIAILAIFTFSLIKCVTGRTTWRGTRYQSSMSPDLATNDV